MLRALAAGVAALLLAGCGSGRAASPKSPSPSSASRVTLPSPSLPATSAPTRPRRTVAHTPTPSRPASSRTASTRSVVVLDPGHNGGNGAHPDELNRPVPMGFGKYKACNTTGTSTNAGYPEHAFTFDLAERISSVLQARGVTVFLTRPNDVGFGPCVNERADFGNREHAAAVIVIHADGAPSSGYGFHVCTASRQPEGASDQTTARSHDMAVDIHDALAHDSGLAPSTYIGSDGYYPRSDLAGLNLSLRPTTFLELGNMRNAHDAGVQSSSSGRARIAASVAAGIQAYLANP